jgi:hypothetical protein
MAIDGRITVDVLFHDTDGTTSLKVVSLEDTTNYNAGKVAIVSGTVGTTAITFSNLIANAKDSAGNAITFTSVSRVALKSDFRELSYLTSTSPAVVAVMSRGNLATSDIASVLSAPANHGLVSGIGTSQYTVVIYGF